MCIGQTGGGHMSVYLIYTGSIWHDHSSLATHNKTVEISWEILPHIHNVIQGHKTKKKNKKKSL